MFEDKKKDLQKKLSAYLLDHPEDAADFMGIVTDALKQFREAVRNERRGEASEALMSMVSFTQEESKKSLNEVGADLWIPVYIDPLYLIIPDPSKWFATTPSFKKLLKKFKEMCIKENVVYDPKWSNWLLNIKGEEKFEWMKKLLENKEI